VVQLQGIFCLALVLHGHFTYMDCESFPSLYKTLICVRVHLECCVQLWSPDLTKDIECIALRRYSVVQQSQASRQHLSYTDRLKYCTWV